MLRLSRKFIAVLMLLWLPVFTGSALAASVLMQLPQNGCNSAAMSHETVDMSAMDMSAVGTDCEHRTHQGEMPAPAGDHGNCGVCHLACTAYLAVVPSAEKFAAQAAARETIPYLVVFNSVTTIPLLPPPLARA